MPMDKMEAHLRQQLSAMMDGELASDEARFLFRRLQHDRELAGCWERWQVCSVVLRGQGEALLPADFSQRVARALADEAAFPAIADGQSVAATGTHSRRWVLWGGGAALAASLALLVVVPRPASGPAPATDAEARMAATQIPNQPATPSPRPAASPDTTRSPSTPSGATVGLATVLAVADAPRRAAARRNRAATPDVRRTPVPAPAVVETAVEAPRVAVAEPMKLPNRSNPFAQPEPSARPWPRAVLPGANSGAFTASYSTESAASFYPFEPRDLPMPEVQASPGGSGP